MPEVNVEINGRKYRMACEEGQQPHLLALADRFNAQIEGLRGVVGEIGDNRLTVMAGIAVLDDLGEAERRIAALEAQVAELTDAGSIVTAEHDALEKAVAERFGALARRIESIAEAIDQTATLDQ